ncbi:spermatogenesis associated 21 [Umbelopsis sp. WA50703]
MVDHAFNEVELKELKESFSLFDQGQGITAQTLSDIYKRVGMNVSQSEIEQQVRMADRNGNGRVNFDDFLAVMDRQHQHNPEEGLLEVFKIFDKDSDGLVSGQDLQEGMTRFNEKFTEHEISEMVREADVDGDGLINYEEFVKMMTPPRVKGRD